LHALSAILPTASTGSDAGAEDDVVTGWDRKVSTMRTAYLIALLAMVSANPVLAQPAAQPSQKPVDHGPFTPEANRAYQGGGMILQGAPGAPPPAPQATPPGQTPANMVPPR
jgi:hypothetical protein